MYLFQNQLIIKYNTMVTLYVVFIYGLFLLIDRNKSYKKFNTLFNSENVKDYKH
jgi:predicted PurR-regulated permease PerM